MARVKRGNKWSWGLSFRRSWSRKGKLAAWAVTAAVVLSLGLWFFLAHWVPGSRLAGYFPLEAIQSATLEKQDVTTGELLRLEELSAEQLTPVPEGLRSTTLWKQGPGVYPNVSAVRYILTCYGQQGEQLCRMELTGKDRLKLSGMYCASNGQWEMMDIQGAVLKTQLDNHLESLLE